MKELLEYIKILPLSDAQDKRQFASTLEQLYFLHIRTWFNPLRLSEPSKIASDLVRLEAALSNSKSIQHVRLKSKIIKNDPLLKTAQAHENIEQHTIDQIYDRVIEPLRFYIPAVMTAEIISKESNKERWRWLSTIILSLMTATLALIAKRLGDLL